MNRHLLLTLLVAMVTSLGFAAPASAVSDVVDFGDSGIVVVVESSGNGKEYGVAYIPWIPDEFYTFYPSLPAAPGIPWPAGGSPAPREPTPCERALDHLTDIEEEIVWRQETINWANANGYLYDAYGDGAQVWAGSERFQAVIDRLTSEIETLREARNDAAADAKRYCGPPAQS